MKKLVCLILAGVMACTLAACGTAQQGEDLQDTPVPLTQPDVKGDSDQVYEVGDYYTLTIVNTHDIHGRLDDLPAYSTLIQQQRSNAKNILVLEGGDIFNRGPFTEFQGVPEAKIMGVIGYDAAVLGNHDFTVPFENPTAEQCRTQLKNIDFWNGTQILCANVVNQDGTYLDNVLPYTIKELNGVKIGIIGITSVKPYEREMAEVSDMVFLDPDETLQKCIEELDGKTDINILLSHAGLGVDDVLSYQYMNDDWEYDYKLAAVVGADDHYLMTEPIYWMWNDEKSIPIFQHGGEECHKLGRMDLVFQKTEEGFKLVDFSGMLLDTDFVDPDPAVQAVIDEYAAKKLPTQAAA